jgi:hypothetical protein
VVAGRDKSPEEPSEVEVVVERRVVQQQEVGEDAEIRNCVSHFDKDCSSNTSDEGDEGLRPAKRRSLFPIKPGMARTPIRKQTPKPSLRRPSSQSPLATQDEASAAHTRDKHARPLSSTDDGNPCRLCTSRNPSSTATGPMPAAAAEYYEWGLQNGSLKRTTTGDETIFHLQFSLKDLHDLLALQGPSHVSGDRSGVTTPVRSTGSRRPTNQIKTKAPVRRRG